MAESNAMRPMDLALKDIKGCKKYLTEQEYKTLVGQAKHGDTVAAIKGLCKLLKKKIKPKDISRGAV